MPRSSSSPAALPTGTVVRPYVATRLLADLGSSPEELGARTVARIKKSFPVPVEQEVLWAEVELGTRSHGVVLTDAGIFLKDGAPDDEDEVEGAGASGTRQAEPQGVEMDGLGYFYIRWESFDAARVSHVDGTPTLDGVPFLDGRIFKRLAMACVRLNNRRILMRKAARRTLRGTGLLAAEGPVRSVCRASAGASVAFCFEDEEAGGCYKFLNDDGTPRAVEVPCDQYDAALQRMRKKVAEGRVPEFADAGLEDPCDADLAAALVRCGWYTRAQAVNLARTGRIAQVAYRPETGSVVCTSPRGLGACLARWLHGRAVLVRAGADPARSEEVHGALGQALAGGAQIQADASKSSEVLKGEQVGRLIAQNAASRASYAVGATGARVLMSAVGIASGPLAMAAGLVLGDACGKAGMEAFSMVKDMFVEPKARIYERLFSGVLSNVAFEYALTAAEQTLLVEVMGRADQALFQQLGAMLSESEHQEADVRAFLVPLVEAVRRA